MAEPTPSFVLDYIEFLKKYYTTYPVQTAARFNLPPGTIPQFTLEPFFHADRGWSILHRDVTTNQTFLIDYIEPPFAQDAPLPPIQFDPNVPLVVPQYAPPEGYFVLIVENRGLPAGYAATTRVQVKTYSDGLAVTGAGSGFEVPFRGQYELPVLGVSPVKAGDPQPLRYDISTPTGVKTLVGDYEAQQPFYAILPKSGELHRMVVNWFKVDPFIPVAPPATPPHPPTQLPPPPVIPPTGPKTNTPVTINPTQTQPIFYPSTTPRRPTPLPAQPASYKLTAVNDPAGTFRATSVQQMFSFTPSDARSIVYNIGVKPDNIQPTIYKIRNNTINAPLKFTFSVPSFLFINVPFVVVIQPQEELSVTVGFNENDARTKSLTYTRLYNELLEWDVEPLNITGPVYVQRGLSSVTSQVNNSVQTTTVKLDTDSPAFNTLYFAFDQPTLSMMLNERRGIKIDAWIGGTNVGPNKAGSVALQFEPNSIMWEVDKPSILAIESPNGSNNATLVSILTGRSQFKAKIVKPPVNLAATKWASIYNSNASISGDGRRMLLPNGVPGIEIVGTVDIYTSTSTTGR